MAAQTTQYSCSQEIDASGHYKQNCKYMLGTVVESECVGMQMVYPQCGLGYNPLCNALDGAYLPAITVCIQHLWSY